MKEYSELPGMVFIFFSHICDEFVLIGMEYYSNGSLEMYVNNANKKKNNEERIKSFSKQILLDIYDLIERGTIYGGLKPENILIDDFGGLKLADFGLARETNGYSKLSTQIIEGAMRYLSPELEYGIPQSEKSDVWAFGVVLLELAYGRGTYKDLDISRMDMTKIRKEFETKGGYSNEMSRFIAKCFERESADRATIKELLEDEWLEGVNINTVTPVKKSGNNN